MFGWTGLCNSLHACYHQLSCGLVKHLLFSGHCLHLHFLYIMPVTDPYIGPYAWYNCTCDISPAQNRHANLFFSILLTHEGSNREAYRDFQPSLTSSAGPVPRVDQTSGFVHHKQPTLPNCYLCINTERTTSE